jgi:hypothetical protein
MGPRDRADWNSSDTYASRFSALCNYMMDRKSSQGGRRVSPWRKALVPTARIFFIFTGERFLKFYFSHRISTEIISQAAQDQKAEATARHPPSYS